MSKNDSTVSYTLNIALLLFFYKSKSKCKTNRLRSIWYWSLKLLSLSHGAGFNYLMFWPLEELPSQLVTGCSNNWLSLLIAYIHHMSGVWKRRLHISHVRGGERGADIDRHTDRRTDAGSTRNIDECGRQENSVKLNWGFQGTHEIHTVTAYPPRFDWEIK